MYFTTSSVALTLALASSALAAPYSSQTTSAPAPTSTLSLTQQLFLADT